MIRYLKNLNELDADFAELITEHKVDCQEYLDRVLNSTVSGYLNDIKKSQRYNEEQRECLEKQFNNSTLIQLSMKVGAYEVVGYSTNHSVKEIVKSIYREHDKELQRIGTICGIFEDPNNERKQKGGQNQGSSTEYCVKLYLSAHKYIDTNVYKVDMNPHNLDTKNIDCETEIKKVIETFDQGIVDEAKADNPKISKDEIDCMLDVYRKQDFMWKSLFLSILESVDMDESTKNKEIKKFITFSSSVRNQAEMCVQEIGDDTNNNY
jgi:hypothetical protein